MAASFCGDSIAAERTHGQVGEGTLKRRRRAATQRMYRAPVTGANQRWVMDFVHDVLAAGTKVQVFTLIDVWRREGLALRVRLRFSGSDVAAILDATREQRGTLPPVIQCDKRDRVHSTILDRWRRSLGAPDE